VVAGIRPGYFLTQELLYRRLKMRKAPREEENFNFDYVLCSAKDIFEV
jgi:hypothetical protein